MVRAACISGDEVQVLPGKRAGTLFKILGNSTGSAMVVPRPAHDARWNIDKKISSPFAGPFCSGPTKSMLNGPPKTLVGSNFRADNHGFFQPNY